MVHVCWFSVHFFAWLADADKKKIYTIYNRSIKRTLKKKMEQQNKKRKKKHAWNRNTLHLNLPFSKWILYFSCISIFDVLRVNTLAFFNFLILNDVHPFLFIFICCSSMRTTGIICPSQSVFWRSRKKIQIIICNLFYLRWGKCKRISRRARKNNNQNKIFSPSRRIWKIVEAKNMHQQTKAVKLYFIIDLARFVKRPLSPSVRCSFTHSKSPSSPIAPFLLQPLFIHFLLSFACIHLYLHRHQRTLWKANHGPDTIFCVWSRSVVVVVVVVVSRNGVSHWNIK